MYKFLAFYGQLHFFTSNVHFHQRRLTLTSLQFTLLLLKTRRKNEEQVKPRLKLIYVDRNGHKSFINNIL